MQAMKKQSAARPTRAAARPARRALAVRAAKTASGPRVAIVGITGAVGQEFLTVRHALCFLRAARPPSRVSGAARAARAPPDRVRMHPPEALAIGPARAAPPPPQVMKERNFPYSELKMLASKRCAPPHQLAAPAASALPSLTHAICAAAAAAADVRAPAAPSARRRRAGYRR